MDDVSCLSITATSAGARTHRTHAYESATNVVIVDGGIGLSDRIGDRGQVDNGIGTLESLYGRIVVIGAIGSPHLGVGRLAIILLLSAIDLNCAGGIARWRARCQVG